MPSKHYYTDTEASYAKQVFPCLLQSFAERQVRDTAEEVPADYAPPDFTTAALQHTNVKLTWDADDDTRKKALRKKMTEDSIRDDDFKVRISQAQ